MNHRRGDRITGALGMALSVSYVLYARGIEDSLLADGVGANGVPTGVGAVLLLASLALFLKSFAGASHPDAHAALAQSPAVEAAAGGSAHPHRKALGLLGILLAYVTLLPQLGYVLSIALLVGAVAWYAGARQRLSILACMVLAGPLLWLLFDWALAIRMPTGVWAQLLGMGK